MPASPADSALYRNLFNDDEVSALFTDSAELRALMLVAGTLAKVQGALGVIPETAGAFLHRASFEVQIDPSGLAAETARLADPVPPLVAAFRKAAEAPEHTAHLQFGTSSDEMMDAALALRLRRVMAALDARLAQCVAGISGQTLSDHHQTLTVLRHEGQLIAACMTQISLAADYPAGAEVRAAFARALNLSETATASPQRHRAAMAAWLAKLVVCLQPLASTLGPTAEASTEGAGRAMPNALAAQCAALNGLLQAALDQPADQARLTEWLCLPQLCILAARAVGLVATLTSRSGRSGA